MANPYGRCRHQTCLGNMWPTGQKEHKHLEEDEWKRQLKLKHRVRKSCRSVPAAPRTNPGKKAVRTIMPRRRAYGPF